MKTYQVLLALLCINYIYSETVRCDEFDNPSKEVCNAGLSDKDKERGYLYCCYIRYKRPRDKEERKSCQPLTEYQYKNLDEYIKYYKLFEVDSDDFNIECGSTFFKFTVLSLILLLL